MTEFLTKGHIREYKDIRELDTSTSDLITRIRYRMRECEKYGIDYEAYIEKDYLKEIISILDCCLRNKDNKHIKRLDLNEDC